MSAVVAEAPPQPFFLPGSAGRLFCVRYGFADAAWSVLYLPPFGEEMNRARRMAALLGRAVAAAGGALVVLDPFGTGDSDGDFGAATWEQWRDDARTALDRLAADGPAPVAAVGLRTGALLALDLAKAARLPRVVLWQPVLKGELFLSQLLRVRVAAGMEAGTPETARDLRGRLTAGETLDVAGYPVTPAMAEALEAERLEAVGSGYGGAVDWVQIAADPEAPVPPAVGAVVSAWLRQRMDVTVSKVAGQPFWSIEETTLVPALLTATVETLRRRPQAVKDVKEVS